MRWLIALAILASASVTARAEPNDVIAHPLVLPAGGIEAAVTAEIDLAPRRIGRPLSLAPDLWFGVTSRWTVGVIHSNASISRIAPGASYCFRHTPLVCDRTYSNAGLDVRYRARAGALAVAPRLRVLIRDVDPWKPAVTAGALVRWTRGRFAITSDPYLRVGLANTDRGNRAALFVPVVFAIQPVRRIAAILHTGYDTDLAVWRDGWHVPMAFGLRARVTSQLELGVLGGLTSALGAQNTRNRRVLFVSVRWRPASRPPLP